jgi:hypothetical protein
MLKEAESWQDKANAAWASAWQHLKDSHSPWPWDWGSDAANLWDATKEAAIASYDELRAGIAFLAWGALEMIADGLELASDAASVAAKSLTMAARGATILAEFAKRAASAAERTAQAMAAYAAEEAAIARRDDAYARALAAAYARQQERKLAALRAAAERALKKAAARTVRAAKKVVKVVGHAGLAVVKAAYKYSGAQSVVSCVTNPALSPCLKAAAAVAMIGAVVLTGGGAAAADVAADAAVDAAEDGAADVAEEGAGDAAEEAADGAAKEGENEGSKRLRNFVIGAGFGGAGSALSGIAQGQGWKQVLGDAAFGAAFGGIAGAPESKVLQVGLGAVSGFGNGAAQQMVGAGWQWSKFNPEAAGIDAGLGAGLGGFGAYASSEDRLGDTWAPVMSAGFGVSATAGCTIVTGLKLGAC